MVDHDVADGISAERIVSIADPHVSAAEAQVADDDINDAFASLWTAERILNGSAKVIPDHPCRDPFGLRMEICY